MDTVSRHVMRVLHAPIETGCQHKDARNTAAVEVPAQVTNVCALCEWALTLVFGGSGKNVMCVFLLPPTTPPHTAKQRRMDR